MMQDPGTARDLVYTATEIATFIAALGVLITGVGAVIVNIIVALKQGARVEAAALASGKAHAETQKAVEKVEQEAKVIAGHVNSAATASTAKIDGLQKEVEQLKSTAAEMKSTAALLAQALASNRVARATDKPPGDTTTPSVAEAAEKLAKIEANTAETVAVLKEGLEP